MHEKLYHYKKTLFFICIRFIHKSELWLSECKVHKAQLNNDDQISLSIDATCEKMVSVLLIRMNDLELCFMCVVSHICIFNHAVWVMLAE